MLQNGYTKVGKGVVFISVPNSQIYPELKLENKFFIHLLIGMYSQIFQSIIVFTP